MILLKIQHIIHTYRQSSSSEKAVTTGPSQRLDAMPMEKPAVFAHLLFAKCPYISRSFQGWSGKIPWHLLCFDIDCNWTTRWHRHACTVPFSSCHGFCAELNPAQNPDIKIHDLAFMHVMAALLYRWKHSGVSALNQAQFAVYESVLKSWTWVYIFSWHFQDFWEILLYFPWFPGLEFDDLKFQVFQEVHEPQSLSSLSRREM